MTVTTSCTTAPAATVVTTWCWASWTSVTVFDASFTNGTVTLCPVEHVPPTSAEAVFVTFPASMSDCFTV